MKHIYLTIFVVCVFNLWYSCATVEVLRPRGVSLSKKIFYVLDQDFNCIDGSNRIPFSFVNDDYCDCDDGSDEPGTAACSNAFFHCINSGHASENIPSSRVNDNICDCCDGGDEYNSTADCVNTCFELGRQAREEKQKQQELYETGFGLWQQYSTQGKQIKENNKAQLETLKNAELEEERTRTEKEAIKNEAEDREKAALDVYKAAKEEQQKIQEEIDMLRHQEAEKKLADAAFQELDLDHDSVLTFSELQQFQKFDTDKDGHVSEDEAKFFLHMKDSMALDEFVTTGWMIMKPVYLMDKEPVTESSITEETEKDIPDMPEINEEQNDDETYNPDDDAAMDDDDLSDEETEKPPVFTSKEETETKPDTPEYDEETQQLVGIANQVRTEYKVITDKLDKVREEIRELQSFIDADFGTGEEFAVLKGQCFDFDDREYTYRFCPFDKASQISKSGGSDVSLGRWGSWAGPDENKYSKMKYDNGQLCWNGPSRSVMVLLQCGLENKLLSSSEPNRCEYLFEFSTPAMCSLHQSNPPVHRHTEL